MRFYTDDLLDTLFQAIDADEINKNPFETTSFRQITDRFNNKYIKPIFKESFYKGDECSLDFSEIILTTRETAFKIGFKTAIRLLMQ